MEVKNNLDVEAWLNSKEIKIEKLSDGNLKVIIPDGIIEMKREDFCQLKRIKNYLKKDDQEKIVSVQLPNTLKKIPREAFSNWKDLREIEIPATVEEIGSNAFMGCIGLKRVTFEENSKLVVIKGGAFSFSGIESIVIPSIFSINYMAFYACPNLKKVTILGCRRIEKFAFEDCRSLKSVELPQNLNKVGDCAFWNTEAKINIPDGIEEIDDYAFERVRISNKHLKLANVKSLGEYAFAYCAGIRKLTIGGSLKNISPYAFSHCLISHVELKEGIRNIENGAFIGNSLDAVIIPNSVNIQFDERDEDIEKCFDNDVDISVVIRKGEKD